MSETQESQPTDTTIRVVRKVGDLLITSLWKKRWDGDWSLTRELSSSTGSVPIWQQAILKPEKKVAEVLDEERPTSKPELPSSRQSSPKSTKNSRKSK